MTNSIYFTVRATPEGQPRSRPRFGGRGFFIKRTKFWEACMYVARMWRPHEPLAGPVKVDVTFYMPRPKSVSKKETWQAKRPDIDNIAKGLLDAMTHAGFWKDDGCVAELNLRKLYACPGFEPQAHVAVHLLTEPT